MKKTINDLATMLTPDELKEIEETSIQGRLTGRGELTIETPRQWSSARQAYPQFVRSLLLTPMQRECEARGRALAGFLPVNRDWSKPTNILSDLRETTTRLQERTKSWGNASKKGLR